MKHHRKTKKRGGMKLGEGQLGFTVFPAIECRGKDTKGMVSKVFKSKEQLDPQVAARGRYKEFSEIRKRLEPISKKLSEIDPEQKEFIRPIFCNEDDYGELTPELIADGVTEATKKNSYLMNFAGIVSYEKLMSMLFKMLNISYARLKLESNYNELPQVKRIPEYIEILKSKFYPLIYRIHKIVEKLHMAKIAHNDLHGGNVVLTLPRDINNWYLSLIGLYGYYGFLAEDMASIYDAFSGSKSYRPPVGLNEITMETIQTLFKHVEDMRDLDFSKIIPKIIDWDSSTFEEDTEYLDEELDELVFRLLPDEIGPFKAVYYDYRDYSPPTAGRRRRRRRTRRLRKAYL
jgi:hypothetical protein